VFLIPTAMVAAELAAMSPTSRAAYSAWVGEAYGARTGFLAIWLQWIESTIWYPTVLTLRRRRVASTSSTTNDRTRPNAPSRRTVP